MEIFGKPYHQKYSSEDVEKALDQQPDEVAPLSKQQGKYLNHFNGFDLQVAKITFL